MYSIILASIDVFPAQFTIAIPPVFSHSLITSSPTFLILLLHSWRHILKSHAVSFTYSSFHGLIGATINITTLFIAFCPMPDTDASFDSVICTFFDTAFDLSSMLTTNTSSLCMPCAPINGAHPSFCTMRQANSSIYSVIGAPISTAKFDLSPMPDTNASFSCFIRTSINVTGLCLCPMFLTHPSFFRLTSASLYTAKLPFF
mmetsp:Transcript_4789/g.8249  ORF Transcript_4789/g.8249 Transcript_4789/m.8249 type:complete len:202 (+) Transcript_4789:181-786(+)